MMFKMYSLRSWIYIFSLISISNSQYQNQVYNAMPRYSQTSGKDTSDVLSLFENEPVSPQIVEAGSRKKPLPGTGLKRVLTLEEINRAISQQHQEPIDDVISPGDIMFGDSITDETDLLEKNGNGITGDVTIPNTIVNRPASVNSARTPSVLMPARVPSVPNARRNPNRSASVSNNRRNNGARAGNGGANGANSPAAAGDLPDRRRQILNRQQSRRSRQNQRVSEGHRLITRALWRIFDALMEKNENAAIHDRVNIMENGIRQVMLKIDEIQGQLDEMKMEAADQDLHVTELALGMHDVKMISEKVQALEDWKGYFQGSQNDDVSHLLSREPAYSACPPPFVTTNGECFYLVDSGKQNWHDARRQCAKFGGDLAAPNNLGSLREYLQDLDYMPEYVWVGATRQGNGLDWLWLSQDNQDGEKVDMSIKTWNKDLPAGLGNCMGLYKGAAYRAYDYSCEEPDLYVCQYFL